MPHIKGLRIAHHNKTVHQIAHTLQSNKHTRYYTLINASNQNSRHKTTQSHNGYSNEHAPQPHACLARLGPNILCVLGAPTENQPPLTPSSPNVIQFIRFTYCHEGFPNTSHSEKKNPLTITYSYKNLEQLVGKWTLSSPSQKVLEELFTNNQLKT